MTDTYWSIKTGKFREKFEVSTSDDNAKVFFDVSTSPNSCTTQISHFWLDIEHAREIAEALLSAAAAVEKHKK